MTPLEGSERNRAAEAASSTLTVHGGEEKRKPCGALTTPIFQTSTYTFEDTAQILEFMRRKDAGHLPVRDEYGRYSNPTQSTAERKIAALEGGERALLFASGMNAITTTLLTMLSDGDHLVMVDGAYRRTEQFAREYLPRWGIDVTFVPIDDAPALAAAIQPNTRVILSETPTNPYLRVMDLARMVEVAREHDIITVIDSTFATPINLRPLEYGLDLVIHSATKYLGGHNDLLAGAVIGGGELLNQIEDARGVLGGMSNPNDAYLLIRGMKTLDLRVRRQNENGQRIAEFLNDHPSVSQVHYPGLSSHPDHEIARRQMRGFGGVVSFEINGVLEKTGRFIDRLHLPYVGPTLGGVESVIEQMAALFSLDPQERQEAGIKDNLVRYALGIEEADDIIADLDQALAGI
ncbi:MAG: aminotransferase class I/II-fold pyridoxal phosphate-dependent enzyme [Anaerolineae bacterium]|jgi:cystathionine gamma-synthase